MATLEADLGAVLLPRRPVTVNEAGARLLEHSGPLLAAAAAHMYRAHPGPTSPPHRPRCGPHRWLKCP
jgi:DNA-binding transcriptional LysR family regulator